MQQYSNLLNVYAFAGCLFLSCYARDDLFEPVYATIWDLQVAFSTNLQIDIDFDVGT